MIVNQADSLEQRATSFLLHVFLLVGLQLRDLAGDRSSCSLDAVRADGTHGDLAAADATYRETVLA